MAVGDVELVYQPLPRLSFTVCGRLIGVNSARIAEKLRIGAQQLGILNEYFSASWKIWTRHRASESLLARCHEVGRTCLICIWIVASSLIPGIGEGAPCMLQKIESQIFVTIFISWKDLTIQVTTASVQCSCWLVYAPGLGYRPRSSAFVITVCRVFNLELAVGLL